MMMNGTGRPMSQPVIRTFFRPILSEVRAANRLQTALVTPKLTMKDTMAVFETRPNSLRSEPTCDKNLLPPNPFRGSRCKQVADGFSHAKAYDEGHDGRLRNEAKLPPI